MKDGKMLQKEAAQESKENVRDIVVHKGETFVETEPDPEWTAKAKKRAVYFFEKEGKKVSMPVHTYLKQEAMKLPPMLKNGRRVVHFDQMWWHFMSGQTKEESMQAVSAYCKEVVEIWNKAVEEQRMMLKEQNKGLMFEDDLPEMTDEEYCEWLEKSRIVDGVRMGPIVETEKAKEDECNN